jgi:hypothetical protein
MINKDIKEYWENLKHFETPEDIPDLPGATETEWNDFFIPILIKCGAIPKKDLTIGKKYLGSCRNSEYGIWNGLTFTYKRTKFGSTYNEEINHFEDDDGYDLFVPIKEI